MKDSKVLSTGNKKMSFKTVQKYGIWYSILIHTTTAVRLLHVHTTIAVRLLPIHTTTAVKLLSVHTISAVRLLSVHTISLTMCLMFFMGCFQPQ